MSEEASSSASRALKSPVVMSKSRLSVLKKDYRVAHRF